MLIDKTCLIFRCVQNKQFNLVLFDLLGIKAMELPDISEDCLYLNIYTPANRAQNAKLPVRTLCCRFEELLLN